MENTRMDEWKHKCEEIGLAARSSSFFDIIEFPGVPNVHPSSTSRYYQQFLPPGRPCTFLLSRGIQMFSVYAFLPIPVTFFSSFIRISVIFCVFISASVCPSHHLGFYLLFLRSFCLFVFLSLFHRPLFLGQFPFFCLWPSFLPSCRKAINPAAMQQAAANHWAPEDEGRKEEEGERGTWKCWGAVATKREGRSRKEQRCHSQKAATAASTAGVWTPSQQGADTWPLFLQ